MRLSETVITGDTLQFVSQTGTKSINNTLQAVTPGPLITRFMCACVIVGTVAFFVSIDPVL